MESSFTDMLGQLSSIGNSGTPYTTTQTATGDYVKSPELFQPGLFPSSSSISQSKSSSNNFSGLDTQYRNPILDAVVPQIQQSVNGLSAVPGQYADSAAKMYSNLSNQALNQSLPQVLQQLAARGMLNSSVGSDAITNAAMQIIPTYANMGYQAQMDAGKMQMAIPSLLAQIGQLGNYSKGSNTSTSTSTSLQQDPLAPYALLSNFLMGY